MTLGELKAVIDRQIRMHSRSTELRVTIGISQEGWVGARPCTDVKWAGRGIDWEHGRFELMPSETLTVKP